MILIVTSGRAKNVRSNCLVLRRTMTLIEGGSQQGAFAVGFQNSQLDALARRQHAKMVAHRHFDEGRDVEQLVLLLPHAGVADFA